MKNEGVWILCLIHNWALQLDNFQAQEASRELNTQLDLLHFSRTDDIDCNIVSLVSNIESNTNQVDLKDIFWFLYFDGYKNQESVVSGLT